MVLKEIQDYFIISSKKLKHGWTLTTSQYTITHTVYFKTQRTVTENAKYIWVHKQENGGLGSAPHAQGP